MMHISIPVHKKFYFISLFDSVKIIYGEI